MRIGLNLLFLIPGEVGGTETYTRYLLKALAEVDPRDQYVVFINRESRQLDFLRQPNFSVVECPIHARNRAARLLWEQFVLPFKIPEYKLDLLHSLGYVAPLVMPCKSVVTIHDLNYKFVPESMTALTRVVQRVFVTLTARRADTIIVVSEFVRTQVITHLKLPPDKVTAVHKSAEQNVFSPARKDPALPARYGISRPYVFAFSSLTPHKNISALIRAFAQIKAAAPGAFQLVIVGHQPRTSGSLRVLADGLNLNAEEVVFTGYVDDAARGALLSQATVFAFPSLYEGFGLPVLEAMASGVAVACSNRASLPEIAGEAAAYFDPVNVEQMAEVLGRLLKDAAARQSLVARGGRNLERFSWKNTARQTLDVYEKTVG